MLEFDYYSHLALSKSALDILAKSPSQFKAWLDGPRDDSTPSMDFGRALHLALFEPEKHDEIVKMYTKKNKKDSTELKVDYYAVMEIAKKIKDSEAGALFQNGLAEQAYFGRISGIDFKCKVDYIIPDKGIILDLKSTRDCAEKPFINSVLNYRYHVQDAIYKTLVYQNGIKINKFIFLAIEKVKPYNFALYELEPKFFAKGIELLSRDVGTYLKCQESNNWGEKETLIQTLQYPAWAN